MVKTLVDMLTFQGHPAPGPGLPMSSPVGSDRREIPEVATARGRIRVANESPAPPGVEDGPTPTTPGRSFR